MLLGCAEETTRAVTAHAKTTDRARHVAPTSVSQGGGAPTAWGRTLAALLAGAASIGIDPAALGRALDVDARSLHDPDARVPLETIYALLERVVADTGDELAPLRLAQHLDAEALDALGLLAISSATFGVALEHTIRYQRVFAEGERYELERTGAHVHVRYVPWGPPRPGHVWMAELFARDLAVSALAIARDPIAGVRVRLRRAEPADRAAWRSLLGTDAELGAPLDEVIFPRAAMDAPIVRADPALARFFERYLDERLARLPEDSLLARARAAVEELLPAGPVTLGQLARRMRSSPRTLQRRLADAGTSLTDLAASVRRARALALVEAGVSFAEIAWMLGYSEPSAFHRAFRRWTGTTALAWRASHRP